MIEKFTPPSGINPEEQANRKFLGQRATMVRLWPYAAAVSVFLLVALFLWLQDHTPMLVHPGIAAAKIRSGQLDVSLQQMMASMLPVCLLMLLGLMLAVIGLITLFIRHEKRYLAIIAQLQRDKAKQMASAFKLEP